MLLSFFLARRKKLSFISINLKQEMKHIWMQTEKTRHIILWKFLMASFPFIEYTFWEKTDYVLGLLYNWNVTFKLVLFPDMAASMVCNMVNVFYLMYSELWTAHETLNTICVRVVFLAECQMGLPWGKPYAVYVNITRKYRAMVWI